MLQNTKDSLKCIMNEVKINPKLQRQLLCCVESGKCFPFVPKGVIQPMKVVSKCSQVPSAVKLPSRPFQRPKSVIDKLDNYEREQFRPNPSMTRPPNEKQRLQNLMAYGKNIDEELENMRIEGDEQNEKEEPLDMFSEISREIKERQEFLEDMIALGEGKKYVPEIQCQIALRLRELEKMDQERAATVFQK